MLRESKVMLYALLVVTFGPLALVLLSIGPNGWFLVAFLGIAVMAFRALTGSSEARAGPSPENCPACGAPNAADRDACSYCDASL